MSGQMNSGEGDPRNWLGVSGRDANQRHGGHADIPVEALTSDDPELHLAWADMAAWHEAHPCECEAGCECEETDE